MSDFSPPAARPDETTRLFQQFEAETGGKTFYSGHLSWLNNLVATGEDLYDTIAGDDSPDTWWGCADAAPALQGHLQQNATDGTKYETMTSRNWLGMQHNQVVAQSPDGAAPRLLDPWAGGEVPMPKHTDDTILPIGQGLELLFTGEVEPTGYGANRKVTGNERFDVSGPLSRAYEAVSGLFGD